MKKMKFLLISFVVVALSIVTLKSQAQTNWTLDQTVGGVEFYHQITQCNGYTVVFLKFNNTTGHNVSISWKEVFDTQVETGVLGWRGPKQMILIPGTTLRDNCTDTNHPECLIVPLDVSPAYPALIRAFAFANITVVNTP